MRADQIRMLLRWCRGRELGIGRFSRCLMALSVSDANLAAVRQEIYSRHSTTVAFHAVSRAMAFESDNVGEFDLVLEQLGPARVCKAALSAALLSAMPDSRTTQVFDYDWFQKRCLFVAFVLETLSQMLDSEMAGDAFIVGLLMDGSYLLMLELFESDLELSLFTRINNPSIAGVQAEEMYLGFSNSEVAATIAEDIKLRPCSIDALRHYCSPLEYEGKHGQSVDLCHLTSVIADYAGYAIAPGLPCASLDLASFSRLGLKKEYMSQISEAIDFAHVISHSSVALASEAVQRVRRFSA